MRALLIALVLALTAAAGPARADGWERTANFTARFFEGTFDVLVLRPLSTAALAAGSAFFIASIPLVAPFEGVTPSWNTFVYAPYEYVVLRDIGDF